MSVGGAWVDQDDISANRMNQKTNYIETTEPAVMFAGMFWFDTSSNTLKIRNAANNAWVTQINQSLLTTSSPSFTTVRFGTGYAAPVHEADSDGTKLNLFSSNYDWQMGLEEGYLWFKGGDGFKWYTHAAVNTMLLDGSGNLTIVGKMIVNNNGCVGLVSGIGSPGSAHAGYLAIETTQAAVSSGGQDFGNVKDEWLIGSGAINGWFTDDYNLHFRYFVPGSQFAELMSLDTSGNLILTGSLTTTCNDNNILIKSPGAARIKFLGYGIADGAVGTWYFGAAASQSIYFTYYNGSWINPLVIDVSGNVTTIGNIKFAPFKGVGAGDAVNGIFPIGLGMFHSGTSTYGSLVFTADAFDYGPLFSWRDSRSSTLLMALTASGGLTLYTGANDTEAIIIAGTTTGSYNGVRCNKHDGSTWGGYFGLQYDDTYVKFNSNGLEYRWYNVTSQIMTLDTSGNLFTGGYVGVQFPNAYFGLWNSNDGTTTGHTIFQQSGGVLYVSFNSSYTPTTAVFSISSSGAVYIAGDLTANANVYFPNLPASDDLDDLAIVKSIPIKSDGMLDTSNLHERFKDGNVNGLIGLLLGSVKALTIEVDSLKEELRNYKETTGEKN